MPVAHLCPPTCTPEGTSMTTQRSHNPPRLICSFLILSICVFGGLSCKEEIESSTQETDTSQPDIQEADTQDAHSIQDTQLPQDMQAQTPFNCGFESTYEPGPNDDVFFDLLTSQNFIIDIPPDREGLGQSYALGFLEDGRFFWFHSVRDPHDASYDSPAATPNSNLWYGHWNFIARGEEWAHLFLSFEDRQSGTPFRESDVSVLHFELLESGEYFIQGAGFYESTPSLDKGIEGDRESLPSIETPDLLCTVLSEPWVKINPMNAFLPERFEVRHDGTLHQWTRQGSCEKIFRWSWEDNRLYYSLRGPFVDCDGMFINGGLGGSSTVSSYPDLFERGIWQTDDATYVRESMEVETPFFIARGWQTLEIEVTIRGEIIAEQPVTFDFVIRNPLLESSMLESLNINFQYLEPDPNSHFPVVAETFLVAQKDLTGITLRGGEKLMTFSLSFTPPITGSLAQLAIKLVGEHPLSELYLLDMIP